MEFYSELEGLDVAGMAYDEVAGRIVALSEGLATFWSSARGWAPENAAALLSRSRLDRLSSLSRCLAIWSTPVSGPESDGRLILAWANLGSLVEGTLKLVLAVFYGDYAVDSLAIDRRGVVRDPASLTLEELRQFFLKREIFDDGWTTFFGIIQQRRNAIHFFKDREIVTWDDYSTGFATTFASCMT